jgi:hypothetical protein
LGLLCGTAIVINGYIIFTLCDPNILALYDWSWVTDAAGATVGVSAGAGAGATAAAAAGTGAAAISSLAINTSPELLTRVMSQSSMISDISNSLSSPVEIGIAGASVGLAALTTKLVATSNDVATAVSPIPTIFNDLMHFTSQAAIPGREGINIPSHEIFPKRYGVRFTVRA